MQKVDSPKVRMYTRDTGRPVQADLHWQVKNRLMLPNGNFLKKPVLRRSSIVISAYISSLRIIGPVCMQRLSR